MRRKIQTGQVSVVTVTDPTPDIVVTMPDMNSPSPTKSCVRFRYVINDAVCGPWVDMPEVQPATLKGLADYLKTCPGWDYRRLSTEYQGWNEHQVSYGMRILFWIPEPPTEDEFTWLREDTEISDSLLPY